MKVSIVIPAFNEEKLLPDTLRAVDLAREAWRDLGWESEVIVCNNASTDQTGAVAQAGGARVVEESINQIGRARNTGARAATGDWLLFLDADSLPSRALFSAMATAIQDRRCLAGGTTLQLDGGPLAGHLVAAMWNRWSQISRWIAGAFVFVETTSFWAANGFDERLYASEEIELSKKLKRMARSQGRKVVILSDTPLLTSARKMRLYRPHELFGFFFRAIFRPYHTITHREACLPWYDGRR
jgi:glycosyltransferase involved in cell wall biosynthesis